MRRGEESLPGFRSAEIHGQHTSLAGDTGPARPPGLEPAHLWLAVHLPLFALEVCTRAGDPASPVAVLEGEGAKRTVQACNERAAEQGVSPGLALNAALALCPGLCVRARSIRREASALSRLAAWAGQFTSMIDLVPPDAIVMEVGGSLRLFGGLGPLRERVQSGLSRLGYHASLAVAPTPLAALWLGRDGQDGYPDRDDSLAGRLAPVPLSCLRWPQKLQSDLRGMGVRTLGECLRLPRDGFARRFGGKRLAELDRALGKRADPRAYFVPPQRFDAGLELPAAVHEVGQLVIAVERMLIELTGFLRARQAGVQDLRLRLHHQQGTAQEIPIRLARASREPAHLLDLIGERLQRTTLEAPVDRVGLEAAVIRTLAPDQSELFDDANRVTTAWPQLVERLEARLGEGAVKGLGLVADHRPEAAWCVGEPGTRVTLQARLPRPLWILDRPRPLDSHQGQPAWNGPLQLGSEPERIESGWWDGDDVARDYFVARAADGKRLWIYRERRGGAWFLHGIFG